MDPSFYCNNRTVGNRSATTLRHFLRIDFSNFQPSRLKSPLFFQMCTTLVQNGQSLARAVFRTFSRTYCTESPLSGTSLFQLFRSFSIFSTISGPDGSVTTFPGSGPPSPDRHFPINGLLENDQFRAWRLRGHFPGSGPSSPDRHFSLLSLARRHEDNRSIARLATLRLKASEDRLEPKCLRESVARDTFADDPKQPSRR